MGIPPWSHPRKETLKINMIFKIFNPEKKSALGNDCFLSLKIKETKNEKYVGMDKNK